MPTIAEVRQKFPQYDDLSDTDLAQALHRRFYSDMPEAEFNQSIGLGPSNLDPAQLPPRNPSVPFRERLGGTIGEMLNGVPVAGPALLGLAQRGAALKHSILEGQPFGQALENVQTKQQNFSRDMPMTSQSAGTAGAVGSMLATGGTGLGARALGITGKNLATRSLASMGSGGVIGGADALARGNDPVAGTAVGATFGALAPGAGQAIGAGVRGIMGRGPRIPSIDDMYTNKNWAYLSVDRLGARYNPAAYDQLLSKIRVAVRKDHLNPMRHPKAASMLDDMEAARATWANPGSPTLTELDQLRQIVRRDVVDAGDAAEGHFGDLILDHIDDFVDSAAPGQMAAGNPMAAATAIRNARKANTQLRKAELVQDALTRAARQAASTGSGGNIENAIRQKIRGILDSPSRVRPFTAEERAIMEKIVNPNTKTQDMLRLAGKLSPGGNGLMASLLLGTTAFAPGVGLPVAAAGYAAKRTSEGMTQGRANRLQELIGRGSVARPPLTGMPDAARRAVQAISLGAPLSLYSPLFPSSARVPR